MSSVKVPKTCVNKGLEANDKPSSDNDVDIYVKKIKITKNKKLSNLQ